MSSESALKIIGDVVVPYAELEFTYTHSSGSGGQNVNKVATKAVLRWFPARNRSLPSGVRSRFLETYSSKLTQEGELILSSQLSRSQGQNANDCLLKLREMILSVWRAPKVRRPTKPTFSSKRKRLESKKVRSKIKQSRGKIDY